MTLTSAAISVSRRFWFLGTASAILLLAFANNHVTNAMDAPAVPTDLKEESSEDAEVWSRGVLAHIYYWLECPTRREGETALEIHNATVWKLLKTTYQSVVHAEINSLPPPSKHESLQGYQIPIEIKKTSTEPHSLGVFTKDAISKDTLVWKSTFTAQFTSGSDFRSFLKALPENLACDVIDWSFPRYQAENPVLCVDLDHGSLTNVCEDDGKCNLEVKAEENTGCELEFYASRDIAAGEELQIDHDFQEAQAALIPLGLARYWDNNLEEYEDEDEMEEDAHAYEEDEDDEDDEDEEEL